MKTSPSTSVPGSAHPWDLTPEAAIALQKKLGGQVIRKSQRRPDEMTTVAGADAGYRDGSVQAAVVVLNLADLKTVEETVAARPVTFPYIPGLLSFREGPAILAALEKLKTSPDLLMIDGQGLAHPRRFGIASHIGLLTAIPSVGCAKSRLVGAYEEPEARRGSISYLTQGPETIGAAVRTRTGVKPVFVSVGHLMSLADSVQIVLNACRGLRLPEPIRRADQLSRKQLQHRERPNPTTSPSNHSASV